MRVSQTAYGSAGRSTTGSRSTRWNTMPVSGAAGRNVRVTLLPLWSPTPVALTIVFRVRCLSMMEPHVLVIQF